MTQMWFSWWEHKVTPIVTQNKCPQKNKQLKTCSKHWKVKLDKGLWLHLQCKLISLLEKKKRKRKKDFKSIASLHFFKTPEKGKAWGDTRSNATGHCSSGFCSTSVPSKVQDFHDSIVVKLETQKSSRRKGELAVSITCHRLFLGVF